MFLTKQEAIDELQEIKVKMEELLCDAKEILKDIKHENQEGYMIYERASAYWIPSIHMALTDDHGYLGKCDPNFEETIKEIKEMGDF